MQNLRIGNGIFEAVRFRRSVRILTGGDSEKPKVCQDLAGEADIFDDFVTVCYDVTLKWQLGSDL